MRLTVCCLAVLGTLASPATLSAPVVELEGGPCAKTVRLRATEAPLGEVLQKLADTLGFQLKAKVKLTEAVSLDRNDSPELLLKHLMRGNNLVLQTGPSAACAGQSVVTNVWVLPVGEEGPTLANSDTSPLPGVEGVGAQLRPIEPPPPRPRGSRKRMSEADWQQMKQDYKDGKMQADPQTGLPVPVVPTHEPATRTEATLEPENATNP